MSRQERLSVLGLVFSYAPFYETALADFVSAFGYKSLKVNLSLNF
jgi:hypothetical protein